MPKTKTPKTQIPAVTMDIPEMDTKIADVSIDYRSLHFPITISVYKLYKMWFHYQFL